MGENPSKTIEMLGASFVRSELDFLNDQRSFVEAADKTENAFEFARLIELGEGLLKRGHRTVRSAKQMRDGQASR
jgi:hypothetical protein